MINKVIVCGVRRAKELIPARDIQQFIGRAGRSYTESGEAIILCPSSDLSYAESCLYEKVPPINSELSTIDNIVFHMLPWLDMIYDKESFQKWYKRSLAYIQGKEVSWKEIINYLFEYNCVDEEYNLTYFGKTSVKYYYSPARLKIMKEKLMEANANGNVLELISMSYILSSEYIPTANVDAYELSEYKSFVNSEGYIFEHGELIQAYAYYCILTNNIPKWIKHIAVPLRDDLSRLLGALSSLAEEECLMDVATGIKTIEIVVLRKVPIEIARIIEEFGDIKKSSAYELQELNICNKKDLKEKEDYFINHATESLKKDLQSQGYLKDLLIKEWRSK